jgi:hypothetical protein
LRDREPVGDRVAHDRDSIDVRGSGDGDLVVAHTNAVDPGPAISGEGLEFVFQKGILAQPEILPVDHMNPGIDARHARDALGRKQTDPQADEQQQSFRSRKMSSRSHPIRHGDSHRRG